MHNSEFVFNDYIAYEIVLLLRTQGLRIPEDIAVIGFGDDSFGQYLQPALSTVHQPAQEVGKLSARLLLDQIFSHPEHYQTGTHVLATSLVRRGSTRR